LAELAGGQVRAKSRIKKIPQGRIILKSESEILRIILSKTGIAKSVQKQTVAGIL
jgi:hypothetical protein